MLGSRCGEGVADSLHGRIKIITVLEPELGVTAPFEGLETLVGNSLLCRSR